MDIENIIIMVKAEIEYTERQVRSELKVLRGILDRVERVLDEGKPVSSEGLQGNEWRLYTNLAKLEQLLEREKELEKLKLNKGE